MVNRKMKAMLLTSLVIMLISNSIVMAANGWVWDYLSLYGAETENPGDSAYAYAITYGYGGNAAGNSACYPRKLTDGTDESSTNLDDSTRKEWYDYTWCTGLKYTTFDFEINYDVTWEIGGNSNNGRFSAATSRASGELLVSVDAEPDDPDADDNRSSRWDGEKKEGFDLTGIGISVWGASLSWDNDDDIWGDTNSRTDPRTTVWDGTLDNETNGGTILDKVSLEVEADLDTSCSGDKHAFRADASVDGDLEKFVFTVNE